MTAASNVALPEVPLLAVLPGTGGLTRVTDKRKVRRDLADVFCSIEEGVKGKRAVDWNLVDDLVPNGKFEETSHARAREFAASSKRPAEGRRHHADTARPHIRNDGSVRYSTVDVRTRPRQANVATIEITLPTDAAPASVAGLACSRRPNLDAPRSTGTRRCDPASALQ